MQVDPVQIVAVQHEPLQLILALWTHDHAHVREDVLAPLRYLAVVLEPMLLLELPAGGKQPSHMGNSRLECRPAKSHCQEASAGAGGMRAQPGSRAAGAAEALPGGFTVHAGDAAVEDAGAGVHDGQRHLALLVAHQVQRQNGYVVLQPRIQHAVHHLQEAAALSCRGLDALVEY